MLDVTHNSIPFDGIKYKNQMMANSTEQRRRLIYVLESACTLPDSKPSILRDTIKVHETNNVFVVSETCHFETKKTKKNKGIMRRLHDQP